MSNGRSAAAPTRIGVRLEAGLSDGELLGRFNSRREGLAEAAFEALVRRHGPMVLRTCGQVLENQHGAEDAFQATFLVLARKSSSIQRPELLGNWLYGVALRTAREAKMRDGRRRRLESPAAVDSYPEPSGEAGRPELTLISLEEYEALHEEVSRLPERYRVPVVLCAMEGLTYEEVARRMGCPVGTIGVRLARARERLRSRLIRRGIAPAVALADAIFEAGGVSALMSPALIDSTIQGAAVFAAGDAAAIACLPESAVTLSHAVLGAMTLARIKLATSSVMIVTFAAAVGLVGGYSPKAARPSVPESPPAIADRADQAPAPAVPELVVVGIVEAPQQPEAPSRPLPAMASAVRLAREETGLAARPCSSRNGSLQTTPPVPTAMAWGRSSMRLRAWDATAWERPAAPVRRTRTSSSSRRSPPAADRPRAWLRSTPASAPPGAPSSIGTGPIPPTPRGGGSSSTRPSRNPRAATPRRRAPATKISAGSSNRPRRRTETGSGCHVCTRRRRSASTSPSGTPRRCSGRVGSTRSRPRCSSKWRSPSPPTSRDGSAATATGESAGSAGRRRSPGSTSSSGWPAPASLASRSPAIRVNRSRRWSPARGTADRGST